MSLIWRHYCYSNWLYDIWPIILAAFYKNTGTYCLANQNLLSIFAIRRCLWEYFICLKRCPRKQRPPCERQLNTDPTLSMTSQSLIQHGCWHKRIDPWGIWMKFQLLSNFKLNFVTDGWGISCAMSLDLTDDEWTSFPVMVLCRPQQIITWTNVQPNSLASLGHNVLINSTGILAFNLPIFPEWYHFCWWFTSYGMSW